MIPRMLGRLLAWLSRPQHPVDYEGLVEHMAQVAEHDA